MADYTDFDDNFEPRDEYEVEDLGGRLGNLLLMTGIIISGLLILILLWKFCFTESDVRSETKQSPPKGTPHAVYAHEIEPGFVVLQTQDGQFFRILQEYNNAKWNRTSGSQSAASAHSPSCSSSTWRPITEVETVYTPHYTSAHYQTRPSAPLSAQMNTDIDSELMNFEQRGSRDYPPPYGTGN